MTATTVLIEIEGEDDALGLLDWLKREDDLRDRVRLHNERPARGELGSALDTISVLVTSGGLTAVTTALVAYLKNRGMKIKITAKVGDRTATIEGDRVRKSDLADLNDVAVTMAKELGEG